MSDNRYLNRTEDSGASKILKPIDEEVVKDQLEHRKVFTTERIMNPTPEDKAVVERFSKGKIPK